ncbi:MAG: sugar-binding protein, partial [Bacteroidota bacterium]
MQRSICILLLALFALPLFAQTPRILIEAEEGVNPWNHLEVNRQPGSFQFAIVTDRTGGLRPGVFPVAVDKLNLLQPEFVMSVGDLIQGYTSDEAQIDREWDEFVGFIDQLQMPFFYVPGNHDYINEVMAKKWKERFGRDYYHFVYEDVLFLCLNSEERMRGAGRGYIDEPQLAYIEKVLEENADVTWTMVFLHQPLWDQEDNGKWPEIAARLGERKHTVFAGHRHRYVKYTQNNGKYFVLATTGGGSGMRGPQFGEFDHVVWITMTEEGPIMANLLLEGIWDEDVNTKERYDFTRPLMGRMPWEVSPILLEGLEFNGGELPIKLINDSDVPLAIQLELPSNVQVWAAMDAFEDTLAPNSVKEVRIPLKTEQAYPVRQLPVMELQASGTYLPANQPELHLEQGIRFRPQNWYPLFSTKKSPKVDGKLKDWPLLQYQELTPIVEADPFSHQGDQDGSFAFDLICDEEFLYLAAEVVDDQIEVNDQDAPYAIDGIGFQLHMGPVVKSAAYSGYGAPMLAISPSESGKGEGNVLNKNRLPEGTQTACRVTETGYVVEAAIPLAALEAAQGGNWKTLRLNVVMNDKDKDGAHQTKLYWQPNWRGED